jgi:hypothetical protein
MSKKWRRETSAETVTSGGVSYPTPPPIILPPTVILPPPVIMPPTAILEGVDAFSKSATPRISIEDTINFIADFRRFRVSNGHEDFGHPTFRSWCVANFGERIGGLIDDNL